MEFFIEVGMKWSREAQVGYTPPAGGELRAMIFCLMLQHQSLPCFD